MSKSTILVIGVLIGIATPALVDWLMFGTVSPCFEQQVQVQCKESV